MSGTGRPPRVRTEYTADAQAILLLIRAIKADELRDTEWRERITIMLREVADELINAPEADKAPEDQDNGTQKAG
jgi:hypothetical protein